MGVIGTLFLLVFYSPGWLLAEPLPSIAVVHSYPPGEWYYGIQDTLSSALKNQDIRADLKPLVYHSEYWSRQSPSKQLAEKKRILNQITELKPKALVLCDDEAAEVFALDLHYQGYPLFILGVNKSLEQIEWWDQIKTKSAIVLEEYPVSHLLSSVRRVFPSARKIQIITSKNRSSDIIVKKLSQQTLEANREFSEKLFSLLDPFASESWQDWKTFLQNAHLKTDLVWILVPYDVRDNQGTEVPIERMAHWLEKNLKAPSLGLSSVHPKMGVLLTVSISPQQMATSSALQLASWWKGKPMETLPVKFEKQGQLQVNRATLDRLKVRLPKEILAVSQVIENPHLPYGR